MGRPRGGDSEDTAHLRSQLQGQRLVWNRIIFKHWQLPLPSHPSNSHVLFYFSPLHITESKYYIFHTFVLSPYTRKAIPWRWEIDILLTAVSHLIADI